MDIIFTIGDVLPKVIDQVIYNNNTKKYVVFFKKQYLDFLAVFLKQSSVFKTEQLLDLYCNDLLFMDVKHRFQINYVVLSVSTGVRVCFKYNLSNFEVVNSLSSYFSSSVWFEREVWDMYGILFYNNPDLRRILTDYGFKGFPLRKDFPLSGYVEILYDIEYKLLVFNFIELMQEYRSFEFVSPWNQ